MRKLFIGIAILIALAVAFFFGFAYWVEANFEATINKSENRAYDIRYADFDLHSFFKGVTLTDVSIVPLQRDSGAVVEGSVSKAELAGLAWTDFLFNRRLHLESIVFEEPRFEVNMYQKRVKKKKHKTGLQGLFADIISRANLEDFIIDEGTVIIKDGPTGKLKGRTKRISIWAEEIETDSLKLKYIVPFELGNLRVELDSIMYNINEYTQANMGHLSYDLKKGELLLQDLHLGFDRSWVAVSHKMGIQNDIIDFDLKEIAITEMDFYSSILSDLDIEAGRMSIEGLDLRVQRNKNYERPPDEVKPMFKGMIDLVPFTLIIDTIDVINSKVSYSEVPKGKKKPGTIRVEKINGKIVDLNTAQDDREDVETMKSSFTAELNGAAPMKIRLDVPYDNEAFSLDVNMSFENMKRLNSSLLPLVGVEIHTGHIHKLAFSMQATKFTAGNTFIMDYDSLSLTALKEVEGKGTHKRGLVTSLANAAIRTKNVPGNKHYRQAEYLSERNVYRAPFQFIVQSMMEGVLEIVPSKSARALLNSKKKKEEKHKNKEKKKDEKRKKKEEKKNKKK